MRNETSTPDELIALIYAEFVRNSSILDLFHAFLLHPWRLLEKIRAFFGRFSVDFGRRSFFVYRIWSNFLGMQHVSLNPRGSR